MNLAVLQKTLGKKGENMNMDVVPTTRTQIGGGRVDIRAFGARCEGLPEGFDWSLRDFKAAGDAGKNRPLAEALASVAISAGISNLHAPSPAKFNATLCKPEDLKVAIRLPFGVTLWRGFDASGCSIPKGAAYVVSSGDCPTWAMYHSKEEMLIAGHGGLKELVDYEHVVNDKDERDFRSVIRQAFWNPAWTKHPDPDSASEQPDHDCHYVESQHMFLASLCGIAPEQFAYDVGDPVHGPKNKVLIDWLFENYNQTYGVKVVLDGSGYSKADGMIDIHELIRSEVCGCIMCEGTPGIANRNFTRDGIDTFGDVGRDGKPLWHSNVRSKQLGDGNENKRNLVLVAHR